MLLGYSIRISNNRVKWILLIVVIAVLLCGVVIKNMTQGNRFYSLWHTCLVVSVPLKSADAIIVLGGESLARPLEAARLYKAGIAPRIFVSGLGDAGRNRQILIGAGVPASAITMESKATSTYANAMLLKPLLEAAKVRSAMIVTSSFHTRRALATFRHTMPDVNFGVTEAVNDGWAGAEGRRELNRFAAIEFLKTLEYRLLYGVSPFLSSGIDHQTIQP